MQKNMFKMGKYNKSAAKAFLDYTNLEKYRSTGLCGFVSIKSIKSLVAYSFLKDEISKIAKGKRSINWKDYPVEYSICAMNKEKLSSKQYAIDLHNLKKPENQLRIWWAYNLAVAISQQEQEKE